MKINLLTLDLHNFKGVKDLTIDFGEVTNIKGENGLGKSTVMDAFMWLLFDKDSRDRKNFEIKTINENGQVIHGLEHEVICILEVDGQKITFSKIFKEKWTKKKGMATKEFTGHETLYCINEVPVKKKEYEEKIKEILDEKIFKLVTNPTYFSSLKWQEQRAIVSDIIGSIDDERVINYNDGLIALKGKYDDSVDNYRIRTKATMKKINDQIKQIPFRIDECNNSIVNENFGSLENQKTILENKINIIDEQLEDSSKGNEILMGHKQHLYDLKQEYQDKLNHAKSVAKNPIQHLHRQLSEKKFKVQEFAYELNSLERDKRALEDYIKSLTSFVSIKEKEVEELRKEFIAVNKETFILDPKTNICPMCKQDLPNAEDRVKKLEENFNLNKAHRKEKINEKGKLLNNKIEELTEKIEVNKVTLIDINKKISDFRENMIIAESEVNKIEEEKNNFIAPNDSEIEFEGKVQLLSEIQATEDDISKFKIDDNSMLKNNKRKLQCDLVQVNKLLAAKDNNAKLRERISELGEEERDFSNKVAELEGQLFICEEFVRTKVELSEGLINDKFNNIKFKLFNELINGGLEETCEILVEGVPYSNANTASQINAGLEVINTLSNHYNVTAPIFIDNREAVNKIVSTESQIINLIVTKDKKLLIEVED
ncbi:MAG: ATP-binding protein [Bacilli bacterium]